jgi:transcriptional regulator with XRE-family HTH domain
MKLVRRRITRLFDRLKTSSKAAKKVGLSAPSVTKLCKGHRGLSNRTLWQICVGMNASADYLLGLSEIPGRWRIESRHGPRISVARLDSIESILEGGVPDRCVAAWVPFLEQDLCRVVGERVEEPDRILLVPDPEAGDRDHYLVDRCFSKPDVRSQETFVVRHKGRLSFRLLDVDESTIICSRDSKRPFSVRNPKGKHSSPYLIARALARFSLLGPRREPTTVEPASEEPSCGTDPDYLEAYDEQVLQDRVSSLLSSCTSSSGEVARRINIDTASASRLRNGVRPPSIKELWKICATFDASADHLLGLTARAQGWIDEGDQPIVNVALVDGPEALLKPSLADERIIGWIPYREEDLCQLAGTRPDDPMRIVLVPDSAGGGHLLVDRSFDRRHVRSQEVFVISFQGQVLTCDIEVQERSTIFSRWNATPFSVSHKEQAAEKRPVLIARALARIIPTGADARSLFGSHSSPHSPAAVRSSNGGGSTSSD